MSNLQQLHEEWKDIPEFEGIYQVSNLGRIRSKLRKYTNKLLHGENEYRILNPKPMKIGYLKVLLTFLDKKRELYVHRIVWDAFGDKHEPGIKNHVDHINNIKTDNRIENLQLITARVNATKDKVRQELKFHGINKSASNFSAVIEINRKPIHLGTFKTQEEAHAEYERAKAELWEHGYVSVVKRVHDENLKKCSCCNKVKFKEDFYTNDYRGQKRLRSMCIACDRIDRKQKRDSKKLANLQNKAA